jgi:CRP-like cAMP-binding protein
VIWDLVKLIGESTLTRETMSTIEPVNSFGSLPNEERDRDPIETFLRKVDMTNVNKHGGANVDELDSSVPSLLQCSIKGKFLIFLPSAPGRLLWDVIVAIMIVYYLIVVPMRLAFEPHNAAVDLITGKGVWLVVDILFDLMFLTDIFVNFRTAYLDAGELETDSAKIAKSYLTTWFPLDMVASLPTTMVTAILADGASDTATVGTSPSSAVSSGGGNDGGGGSDVLQYNYIFRALKWFKLIKLVRVARISRIFGRLETITMLWNEGTITLAKSALALWLLWHLIACLYWVVATSQGFCMWSFQSNHTYAEYNRWDQVSGEQSNGFQECYDDWVPWEQITREPFETQYSQAFYWAVMVTTGVGKDINPQSNTEINFTIFVISIGIIAYALLIGSLSSSIQSMAHKSKAHNVQLERVNQFMNFNKVPVYMQVAIKQYYEFKWSRRDVDISAVDDLPEMLKIRLKVMLNREVLYSVPVFCELPPDCVIALTQHIQSKTIFPNEFSLHEGQKNSNIYIIRHGRMKMTRKKNRIKKKWKGLLKKWGQNNRAKQASLANICFTTYRDTFVMQSEQNNGGDEEFITELGRGNFYGSNCLIHMDKDEPERFSVSAFVFTEVIFLDVSSEALRIILSEYPDMKRKLTEFAEIRLKRITHAVQNKPRGAHINKGGLFDTASSRKLAKKKSRQNIGIERRSSLFGALGKYSGKKSKLRGTYTFRGTLDKDGVDRTHIIRNKCGSEESHSSNPEVSFLSMLPCISSFFLCDCVLNGCWLFFFLLFFSLQLWNMDGTEMDWNADYKVGGQMWYLLSTAKARVSKGNYISGFPINETALYANRDFFKEEASIYVTGKKTAKETNTNEEGKVEKVQKEEKDEKEENDTTTASRSKYVVPTETKEEELPMDKKKEKEVKEAKNALAIDSSQSTVTIANGRNTTVMKKQIDALEKQIDDIRIAQDMQFRSVTQKLEQVLSRLKHVT